MTNWRTKQVRVESLREPVRWFSSELNGPLSEFFSTEPDSVTMNVRATVADVIPVPVMMAAWSARICLRRST